ncbi:MAG: PKD domain-containing protein [Thermoanaerobaculaceae bacterium]
MAAAARRPSVCSWVIAVVSFGALATASWTEAGVGVEPTFSPTKYTPGQPITAGILVTQDPKGTIVEVEDHLPSGWTVVQGSLQPSGGVVLGVASQQVRWTRSLDPGQRLAFSYVALPPLHAAGAQGFAGGVVRFSNDTSEVGSASLSRWVSPAGTSCTLVSCAAEVGAGPIPVGSQASFHAAAQTSGCAEAVAFDWDFGDGSAHATSPDAAHAYGAAGSFTWTMTASVASQTCIKTGILSSVFIPSIANAGSHVYLVSNAAHTTGAAGSDWRSLLVAHNPGTQTALVNLYFLKKGVDNSSTPGRQVEIAPSSSLGLEDVIERTFGQSGTSGAILLGSNRPLVVTSRTYNFKTTGTFGQYIEGYPAQQTVTGSQEVRLLQLTKNATFRTNVGFANATPGQLSVQTRYFRADGTSLGTRTVALSAWGYTQEDDVFARLGVAAADDAYAIVSSTTPGARYFAYASVIDGRTNDPVCVVPVDSSASSVSAAGLPEVAQAGPAQPAASDARPSAADTGPPAVTVSHFAGTTGGPGYQDGPAPVARFGYFRGVAVDGSGTIFVADTSNHTIRKVLPSGLVSTIAGMVGEPGSADGPGALARLYSPAGLVVDRSGNVLFAEMGNHTIRKVSSAGVVSTVAGLAGAVGATDGAGSAARFNLPIGLAISADGTLTVADNLNHTVRRISPAGAVTTLAGQPGVFGSADGPGAFATFRNPYGVAVDAHGVTYVTDSSNHTIRAIAPDGTVRTVAGLAGRGGRTDGLGSEARFRRPRGIAIAADGTLWVADTGNCLIRRVTPGGQVTSLAGDPGTPGFVDGIGAAAQFAGLALVAQEPSGSLLVADNPNHLLRRVTPAGAVTTLAGKAAEFGTADGAGPAARFFYQTHVASDNAGNFYVADSNNHTIRKVTPAGVVTTLAGLAGTPGTDDGVGSAARFLVPYGVAVATDGTVWVADTYGHTIRTISPSGMVTTVAGQPEVHGSADGTGSAATFSGPGAIAVDAQGNAWVADTDNHAIRRVTPAGTVTTVAGLAGVPGTTDGFYTAARFNYPYGIAVRRNGSLLVADSYNHTIRLVTQSGTVTTLAGTAGTPGSRDGTGTGAQFNAPLGVAEGPDATVWVADMNNSAIRVIDTDGHVQTVAGRLGVPGSADGPGADARFDGPQGIAVDPAGDIVIADGFSHNLRKLTFTRCSLTCSASASPSSGTAPLQVQHSAAATATGCSGTVAYDWDFGDGSPHSTTQSPLHTYAGVGDHTWTLTASIGATTCSRTGTVTVRAGCAQPAAPVLSAPSTAANGVAYTLSWTATSPDNAYELQESTSSDFGGASSRAVTGTSATTVHTVSTATTFHARVRALDACGGGSYQSSWSSATATAITPQVPSGDSIYLPAAAHLSGAAGTNWRTDLELQNPGAAPSSVSIALLKRDQANASPATLQVTLEPGRGQRLLDVLGSGGGFGFSGAGTLRITPYAGAVMATARSYNDQPAGTFGQFIPGQARGRAVPFGTTSLLAQLAHAVTPAVVFRTNLGLVNTTDQAIQVEVRLFKADGTLLGTRTYALRPHEYVQRDKVFGEVTTQDVPLGFALLRTTTQGGAFIAYASVIDNRTGDPIYVPARAVAW